VILAGRRINDGMGAFIAQKTVKLLSRAGLRVKDARVAILGLTFKEDVPDLRNSKVADIFNELRQFGIEPLVHDPLGDPAEALREYGITLAPLAALQELDALILAVSHEAYRNSIQDGTLCARLVENGVLVDVKSAIPPDSVPPGLTFWSL